MKDATPLTPLAHGQNSIFKCKQHTIHDPCGPEKYDYTMMTYIRYVYHMTMFVNINVKGRFILQKLNTQCVYAVQKSFVLVLIHDLTSFKCYLKHVYIQTYFLW